MKRVGVTYRSEKKIAPYAEALRAVGIEPVLVTPDQAQGSFTARGLVLSGGTDLDPNLYGQRERHALAQEPDVERDALEQRLLLDALSAHLPVLAICRGMQLFNVAHAGGTLVQHIEGHKGEHQIAIAAGTRLAEIFGAGTRPVNSRHHQAIGRVGEGLIVSATSPDGVIEGLERSDQRFAIAVQWHPEDMMPEQRRLFEAFREALR